MRDEEEKPQPDLRGHKMFKAHVAAIRKREHTTGKIEALQAQNERLHTTDKDRIASVLQFMADHGAVVSNNMGVFVRLDERAVAKFSQTPEDFGSLTKARNGLRHRSFSCRETGEYPRAVIFEASCKAPQFLTLCQEYSVVLTQEKKTEIEAAISAANDKPSPARS